jgi:predicted nucleotidyltransferase
MPLLPHHQALIGRFVAACQTDDRVVAALLIGSYAKGKADAYSDLDLYLITTDAAYESVFAERRAFLQRLGELVFLEEFDLPDIAFYIFADGAEGELYFGRESQIRRILNGPYQVLLDKTDLLAEPVSPHPSPLPANQAETLRRQLYWFWHELSHFITALGRGQVWWAFGQLEALRGICVNLARLSHNFAEAEVGDEPYFKVENALPIEKIAGLQAALCPMERGAMLDAAHVIIGFYQTLARNLAQAHALNYPTQLEQVMVKRLEQL